MLLRIFLTVSLRKLVIIINILLLLLFISPDSEPDPSVPIDSTSRSLLAIPSLNRLGLRSFLLGSSDGRLNGSTETQSFLSWKNTQKRHQWQMGFGRRFVCCRTAIPLLCVCVRACACVFVCIRVC